MINLRQFAITTILVLLFILFIYPSPSGNGYLLVKIFVFVSILVLFYQYNIDSEEDRAKTAKSINSNGNVPDNKDFTIELRENYDSLLDLVFKSIIAMNPEYECATYILNPKINNLVLQKSSSGDFPKKIIQDNPLINKIIDHDQPFLIQQSEYKNEWSDLFGDKSWRGSECILGIRLEYNEHVRGCLILMANHFKSVNDRDKNILFHLAKYLSMGISKLQRIEKLLGDKDYHLSISKLFNQINIISKDEEILEQVKDLCRSFLRYDKLTITFPKPNSSSAKVKMIDGFNEDSKLGDIIEIDNTFHGLPYKLGEIINSSNWAEEYSVKGRFIQGDIQQYNFHSILSIPIKNENKILGAISIERLEKSEFSNKDIEFLRLLSET